MTAHVDLTLKHTIRNTHVDLYRWVDDVEDWFYTYLSYIK